MSEQKTEHATFVIERNYQAAPERVFAAWAEQTAKYAWFGPDRPEIFEFEVGGREYFKVPVASGDVYSYDARYQDIVTGQRIVYSYDMHRGEDRISVSLSTVQFEAEGEGTRLTYTEQGAFLDGHDTAAQREHGTAELLDALGDLVNKEALST